MVRRTSKKNKKVIPRHDLNRPCAIYERVYINIAGLPPIRYIQPLQQVTLLKITGFCVMCKQILTKEFPEDYPMEWKFCCFCKALADHLILAQCSKGLILSPHSQGILDKITLVG